VLDQLSADVVVFGAGLWHLAQQVQLEDFQEALAATADQLSGYCFLNKVIFIHRLKKITK